MTETDPDLLIGHPSPRSAARAFGVAAALLGPLVFSGCDTPAAADTTLFEGARLIVGDGSPPIEDASFMVRDGRIVAVGAADEISAPGGSTRIDLSGKTVMPALIDAHVHIGYTDFEGMTDAAENYSPENVRDHLERMAYLGIAAAVSMGLDADDVAFEARDEAAPGRARLLTAGKGIAMPEAGPSWVDRRDRAYGVTTEAEARAVVHELAERQVDLVKIWVDDRGGRVEKLRPELYGAIIDESHRLGLLVVAHVYYLEDAKALLRAGVDGFAHGVRDLEADDELMQLLAARPAFFLIPNLPNSGFATVENLAYLEGLLPETELQRRREQIEARASGPSPSFLLQAENLRRFDAAGVRIVMGTDWPGAGGNAHEEMSDLVAAGMTPADVVTAATSSAAESLGLDDLGTISVGKSADFIVLDADPLENIENTRRIASVFLRGVPVDRAGLRTRWSGRRTPPSD